MVEHLQLFVQSIFGIINDPATTLNEKMEILISHYIDMLIKNPDLPLFVLSEINADPSKLVARLGIDEKKRKELYIVKQWKELAATKKAPAINPIHIMMNVISMIIFPFVGSPLIRNRTGLSLEQFNELMEERKRLIPVWVKLMIDG